MVKKGQFLGGYYGGKKVVVFGWLLQWLKRGSLCVVSTVAQMGSFWVVSMVDKKGQFGEDITVAKKG